MSQKHNWGSWFLLLAVFVIFSCSLVVNKAVNISFYLLVAGALAMLGLRKNAAADFKNTCKNHWQPGLAMASILLAILMRQIILGEFTLRLYDLPSRLAVFILIFWALLRLPSGQIKNLSWAFVAGAALYVLDLYNITSGGLTRFTTINSFSVIFSSELALLMGVFSVLSIAWDGNGRLWKIPLKVGAGLCGLVAVYLSQTRGAWIAIPFFLLIVIATLLRPLQFRVKIIAYAILLLGLSGIFSGSDIVRNRIAEGKNDISELMVKNLNTPTGVRLQLWNASWIMFRQHPLIGVGKENFSAELQDMRKHGMITDLAAGQYHSHNEILYAMSTMGIIGLIATLLTYLVPGSYFWKWMRHKNGQIQAAAAMGLCLCTGYVIFGLVDVMFGWNMCNVFYCVSIAVLMAFIVNKNNELDNQAAHSNN